MQIRNKQNMKLSRSVLAAFICLALIVTAMCVGNVFFQPKTANAAGAAAERRTALDLRTADSQKNDAEGWDWDSSAGELTLTNANFNVAKSGLTSFYTGSTNRYTALTFANASTIIVPEGTTSNITVNELTEDITVGIFCTGSLTVKGGGTLNVTLGSISTPMDGYITAIMAVPSSGSAYNLIVDGATVNAVAGSVKYLNGGSASTHGATANKVIIKNKGYLNARSGSSDSKVGWDTSEAVQTTNGVEILKGTLKAKTEDPKSGYHNSVAVVGAVKKSNGETFPAPSDPKDVFYTTLWRVIYDANGGTDAPKDEIVYDGENEATILSAGNISRSGYTFKGWNTAADGTGTNYEAGSKLTPLNDLTLFAQWTKNSGGGGNGGGNGNGGGTADGGGGSGGAVVGIVIGILLFLLLLIYVCGYFFLYRKHKLDDKKIRVIYCFLPKPKDQNETENKDDSNK